MRGKYIIYHFNKKSKKVTQCISAKKFYVSLMYCETPLIAFSNFFGTCFFLILVGSTSNLYGHRRKLRIPKSEKKSWIWNEKPFLILQRVGYNAAWVTAQDFLITNLNWDLKCMTCAFDTSCRLSCSETEKNCPRRSPGLLHFNFSFNFCGDNVTILWSHWYSLFQTLVDSTHGF